MNFVADETSLFFADNYLLIWLALVSLDLNENVFKCFLVEFGRRRLSTGLYGDAIF